MPNQDIALVDDSQLIQETLRGNTEAFGEIVGRYQSIVCSLAYSATGSLTRSEDIAQETFVTAWKQLRTLREPGRLRSWICGIARNLISDELRRQGREPSHHAGAVEELDRSASPEPLPAEQAATREEEAILWRSIERIPTLYREPLVLFYREGHSIAAVAGALELSEDAVKQRLSRGRKLLNEQIAGFVEGALERTRPGKAFTFGVLAALPVFSASTSAAVIGATAAEGATAAKTVAWAGMSGAIFGPLAGILGSWLGFKMSMANASSAEEKRLIVRFSWISISLVVVWVGGLFALISHLSSGAAAGNPLRSALLLMGFSVLYVVALLALILRFNRAHRAVRLKHNAATESQAGDLPPPRLAHYRSKATFLGLPLLHVRMGRRPEDPTISAVGWIAIGDVAFGVLFAFGGFSVGGISIGGASIGLVSLGGAALGLLAAGGLAVGGWAIGGFAAGYCALGGCALAWNAAMGGVAVSKYIALGGVAQALHANDEVARAFFNGNSYFTQALAWSKHTRWLAWLVWLPVCLVFAWRLKSNRSPRNS